MSWSFVSVNRNRLLHLIKRFVRYIYKRKSVLQYFIHQQTYVIILTIHDAVLVLYNYDIGYK